MFGAAAGRGVAYGGTDGLFDADEVLVASRAGMAFAKATPSTNMSLKSAGSSMDV